MLANIRGKGRALDEITGEAANGMGHVPKPRVGNGPEAPSHG